MYETVSANSLVASVRRLARTSPGLFAFTGVQRVAVGLMSPEPSRVAAEAPYMLASLNPTELDLGPAPVPAAREPEAMAPVAPATALANRSSVPLPLRAPKRPPLPPTPAQRLHLSKKARAKAERCLAQAIYFEAGDQPLRGQIAVAQVVMNRVFSPYYPDDVCAVIYQNANRHLACQFTFACDGKPETVHDWAEWRRAKRIAKDTLDGKVWVARVGRSTHYHANYLHPVWVREMRRLVRYGEHIFYRPRRWGDGSNETNWSLVAQHVALPARLR